MSGEGKAVFLSYASQDSEAAKKICDALRAAGVEVWFDADGGLEHGDEWDAKIRRQIKECVLFIPIISSNTQAREEGYFRIEWDMAAERARGIASGVAFILPVVIDDTRETDALVPDRFRTVQWTKLPGGNVPPDVLQRFLKLWSHRTGVLKHRSEEPGAGSPEARTNDPEPKTQNGGQRPRWLAPVIGGLVVATIAALAIWQPWKRSDSDLLAPRSSLPATVSTSEARQLVAKAWVLMNKPEMARAELDTADELCKRAAALDPTDADVWAAWSQVAGWYVFHNLDNSSPRRAAAGDNAARALRLDPKSFEARLAQANYWARANPAAAKDGEAERMLRGLLKEKPGDPRTLMTLAVLEFHQGRANENIELLEQAARDPGFAAVATKEIAWENFFAGRWAQAEAAANRSIAIQPYWDNLGLKIIIALGWRGDLGLAKATLDRMPQSALQEDWGVALAVAVYQWRREPANTLAFLDGVPRDWLRSNQFVGPKSFFTGVARLMAKQTEAARGDFRQALDLLETHLLDAPNNTNLLALKGQTLRYLGEEAEAGQTLRLVREIDPSAVENLTLLFPTSTTEALYEPPDAIIDRLDVALGQSQHWKLTAAELRLNPAFDPLRGNPRFAALLARAEADPRCNPEARIARAPDAVPAPESPPLPKDKSVAVLAFANLSDDKANEYFSDGISEELLNVLAKIPGLKVSARTSAFYFKGKEVPVPEIAQKLGVAYVVEGSVRKQGDKVRITAQLIKAADGFHVWGDTFTRDLKDIFAVQDEIAGLIARNISPVLNPPVASVSRVMAPEAVQEYLAGRAAAARAGMADLREAVTHFNRAVAAEPKFTAAWVQLAMAHTRLGRWGGTPTLQAWQAARAAIDHARSLEPDLPEVLLALGWILRTADWDWRGAEGAFRRTLQLQPNQPDALTGAAVLLFNIGKTDEAFRLGQQAAQLDPLNASTQIDLSLMFFFSGNWAEAERSARRALQLAPGGASYHSILAWSLFKQERYAEAEAETALESDDVEQATAYGILAIVRGQGAAAREQLARLEEISRTRGDSADLQQSIAWIYASLGEKDHAFAALEKARTSRDPSMSWLRNSWFLQPLFSDPRWNVLLHQVGLADDQLK